MDETPGTSYQAEIVSVTDGDTVRLLFNGSESRSCRLFGIDTPESIYASSVWHDVYDELPPALQVQEFGPEATTRLTELLIGGTGAASPVGLTVTVVLRDVDIYDRLVVTIVNDQGVDIGAALVREGYAFVYDEYASVVPALYNTYRTNQTYAQQHNLVIWSDETPYYPWDYRDHVDEAARLLAYIVVTVSSHPNGAIDAYIDASIVITCSREIEASYISTDYFKLYRTNADMSAFYEQIACTLTKSGTQVTIDPLAILTSDTYYILIIVGAENGVVAIDGARMDANYTALFKTCSAAMPVSDVETDITNVDIWVDGDHTDDGNTRPSRDYFAVDAAQMPIQLVTTVPVNHSVGVAGLRRISYIYDDDIKYVVPADNLKGRYNDLPVDRDPFGERTIVATSSAINGKTLVFEFESLPDMTNREYTFTIPAGVVRGIEKQQPDELSHTIKLLGPLTPLYALPEEIRIRFSAWSIDIREDIIDYDMYKLIFKKSLWTDQRYGTPYTDRDLLDRNQLVICLVIKEMVTMGLMLEGGLRSRMVLMAQIEYAAIDYNGLISELDNCININTPYVGSENTRVLTGIKSGARIDRDGKLYKVYR